MSSVRLLLTRSRSAWKADTTQLICGAIIRTIEEYEAQRFECSRGGFVLLVAARPARAHHSFAVFDANQPVTVQCGCWK